MKKIYQTDCTKETGNCMQACIASLLELQLNDVPFFSAYNDQWHNYFKYYKTIGYAATGNLYNTNESKIRENGAYLDWYNKNKNLRNSILRILDDNIEGVKGFFIASVYSPKYYNKNDKMPSAHAVIIDSKFNIVHDPNPNYQNIKQYPRAKELGYNGIINIDIILKT